MWGITPEHAEGLVETWKRRCPLYGSVTTATEDMKMPRGYALSWRQYPGVNEPTAKLVRPSCHTQGGCRQAVAKLVVLYPIALPWPSQSVPGCCPTRAAPSAGM